MTAAIAFAAVTVRIGEATILDRLDLQVAPGELYGLVGADGAGKSTLLQVATGLRKADEGQVLILGVDPTASEARAKLAYMPQGFGLYPDLTVLENLYFFADLHGLSDSETTERIADLLDRTGLAGFEARRGGQLSGGMKQKLALACALIHEPAAILLDEPTTGVDPLARRAFWRLLEGLREEGVALLVATASMEEAERCDRVGILEGGRLTRQGLPGELGATPGAVMFKVEGEGIRQRRGMMADLPGVLAVFPSGTSLTVWAQGDGVAQRLTAFDPTLTVAPASPTLHEATLFRLSRENGGGYGG